jgi:hypothetical protein
MSDPIQLLADIVHFQSPLPPPTVAPVAKKLCPWAEVPPAELHYQSDPPQRALAAVAF